MYHHLPHKEELHEQAQRSFYHPQQRLEDRNRWLSPMIPTTALTYQLVDPHAVRPYSSKYLNMLQAVLHFPSSNFITDSELYTELRRIQ